MIRFSFPASYNKSPGTGRTQQDKINKARTFAFNWLTDLRREQRRRVSILRLSVHRPAVQLLQEVLSGSILP